MFGFFEKWNPRNDHFEICFPQRKGGSMHKTSLVTDNVQVRRLVLRKASCLHCVVSEDFDLCSCFLTCFCFGCVSLNYVTHGFPVAVKSRHYLFNCVKCSRE